jgi:hypothetical protein
MNIYYVLCTDKITMNNNHSIHFLNHAATILFLQRGVLWHNFCTQKWHKHCSCIKVEEKTFGYIWDHLTSIISLLQTTSNKCLCKIKCVIILFIFFKPRQISACVHLGPSHEFKFKKWHRYIILIRWERETLT